MHSQRRLIEPIEGFEHVSDVTRGHVGGEGRWAGQITRRPLPPPGESDLDELDPALRRTLAGIWLGQAATEARVATSFQLVRNGLVALCSDEGIVRLAGRAVDDEHRHAALCEELAGRYAGRPLGPGPTPIASGFSPRYAARTGRRS